MVFGETLVDQARLQFKLASTVKDNKRGFFKHVNSRRRIRDDIGLLLDEVGHLTNRDVDKAEMFNVFFTSVFNPGDPVTGGENKLLADPEVIQDFLLQLDSHKSTGHNGIHPRVLRDLASVIM